MSFKDRAKDYLNGGGPFNMGGKRIAQALLDKAKNGEEAGE